MSTLDIRGLTVSLSGKKVIDGADLTVPRGITVLLGRNGCGKSTLMRAILGLIPSKGSITLDGKELGRISARQRAAMFSYLPQRQTIPIGVSVLDYVAMGAGSVFTPPGKKELAAAMDELSLLSIDKLADRRMDMLSGGEARLAALARARIQRSKMILMDEPLAGLDFARQHEFMALLKKDGRTVFMSMHDPMMAWQYADNIILMDASRTVPCAQGSEAQYQKILNDIYGACLRFEQAGNKRLPIWHNE